MSDFRPPSESTVEIDETIFLAWYPWPSMFPTQKVVPEITQPLHQPKLVMSTNWSIGAGTVGRLFDLFSVFWR
jgi:hypothetical protein